MGKPKSPTPPDPKETSAASTGTNIGTAIANSWLNNANQVTPDGTISYSQSGTESFTDPYTGQTYQIPRTTATTTLSPGQQAIKDQTDKAQLNLGTIANEQSGFLKDYLGKPVNLNNEATEARLFELGSKRLDPRFEQDQERLATKLSNQGIKLGSTAYDRAMGNFDQSKNDAYNQLLLTGRAQATQEALTERNQPLNEISALMSGSQVSMPTPVGFSQSPIPTADNAGLINANYNQKMGIYNQQMQQSQSMMGGLFGLGNALIMSDRRTKEDIEKVGETEDGQNIYSYRYKAGGPMQLGLMAQEVEKKKPDAVTEISGIKHVDYSKALKLGGK